MARVTREEALERLREFVAEQGRILDRLTPEQAARRAYRPGGPSVTELADEFSQTRWREGSQSRR